MKITKFLYSITILIFITFTNLVNAETLTFPEAVYEGEIKKGKAHGVGKFTFKDGSKYEGKVSKNRIHGKGKYIDAQGNIFEGKFKYGTLKVKIDNKTRNIIKIKPKTGLEISNEIKGTGSTSNKWFEAQKNASGVYELTAKGLRDMKQAEKGGESGSSGSSSGC
tara:strand:+ start:2260 stop:2754 length:495 start_codon:yes stop_codon:yes gene_type:complete